VTAVANMQPTAEQLGQERSLFFTNLADIFMITTLSIVAITTGSLTILSEAVRGILLVSIQFYSMWVFWAMHRGKLRHFEYGAGKIEQLVWVIVGAGLIMAALWVAWVVVETVFSAQPAASPLGLAIAAIVNAINNVINGLGFYSMYTASRGKESGIFGAQLRARLTMLTATALLQVTLTIAALAKDADIALFLDASGAIFIVGLKLQTGLRMIGQGLPALIDAPADRQVASQIRSLVEEAVPDAQIAAVRTRQVGKTIFARVDIASQDLSIVQARHEQIAAIARKMLEAGFDVDLSFAIASPESGEIPVG
jgi:divalent metal cation (Fe/Co/Zn/Cd) transporter